MDLSQSMQGAGGVGGLLTQVDIGAVKSYAYLYDGNGNVGQLIDNSDGSLDANYEYDPYGNSILASGAAASGNPYRFSTKYLDSEYNLYSFIFRPYDPDTGREGYENDTKLPSALACVSNLFIVSIKGGYNNYQLWSGLTENS